MRSKPIDANTYGDSKAEIVLTKMLKEIDNPGLKKFVGKLLSSCSKHLKNIKFEDQYLGTRGFLLTVLIKSYVDYVDNSWITKDYPQITSYVKNCVMKRLKQ